MKNVKKFFNNILILALLLVLGLGLLFFLSSRLQDSEPTGQADEATSTPVQIAQEPTATPTIEPDELEDDRPEPTWTPAIIIPEGTPPPLPSPPPTFTPTPVNPKESVLYSFDREAFIGEISPDGKILSFIITANPEDARKRHSQLWLMDLSSGDRTKLVEYGFNPIWSRGGTRLIYETFRSEGFNRIGQIRVVDVDGKNDTLLFEDINDSLYEHYLSDDGRVALIMEGNRIDKVDVDGIRPVESKPIIDLGTAPSGVKPNVGTAPNDTLLLIDYAPGEISSRGLRVILPDGQENKIATEDSAYSDFALSPNGRLIAYLAAPRESGLSGSSLWITDLRGERQRKILDLTGTIADRGAILRPVWSPDGNSIIIILTEYGTNPNYRLAQVDVRSEKVVELGVDEVDYYPIFSPDGKYIYYSRTVGEFPTRGKTTFYRLELEQ